jgi:signal transduction histidine kinase
MSQTAGVLIVGSSDSNGPDFGADHATDFTAAKRAIHERQPSVMVIAPARHKGLDEFCEWTMKNSPDSLWLIGGRDLPPSQIAQWLNFGRVHDVIEDLNDPTLEEKLRAALEAAGEQAQRRKLVEMFAEQSQQLKRLSSSLEDRVERRQKTLRRSLRTLDQTKAHLESFHKALLGIHRASSVVQMEQTLSEALSQSVNLVWARVRFENQSLLKQQTGAHILHVDIPFPNENLRGQVVFAKAEGGKFSADEVDFLHEISEALGLALSRLHKLEQAEMVKAQWQATFDAIPHPLCLTADDGEILKLNRAFQLACDSANFRSLIGKNCFRVFFGADFIAPVPLNDGFTFRASRPGARENFEGEHFEVTGQSFGMSVDGRAVRLVLLRSITEEMRFERRILEASKLAELGTIGSSIAHELNNPLGGMLSFLQLILLDLKKDAPLYKEIKAMESAVLRCRDIVQNLLSFARKQDLGEFAKVDLRDVVERSVKLIELQSKSKGIFIDFTGDEEAPIYGSANALSQALCNLLQNSIDAVGEKIKEDPLFPGRITLTIESRGQSHRLTLADNGTGIRREIQSQIFNPRFTTRDPKLYSGMGLTTAFTIVSEHHGSLEILSQTGSGTTALLTFPRS